MLLSVCHEISIFNTFWVAEAPYDIITVLRVALEGHEGWISCLVMYKLKSLAWKENMEEFIMQLFGDCVLEDVVQGEGEEEALVTQCHSCPTYILHVNHFGCVWTPVRAALLVLRMFPLKVRTSQVDFVRSRHQRLGCAPFLSLFQRKQERRVPVVCHTALSVSPRGFFSLCCAPRTSLLLFLRLNLRHT